MKSVFHKITAVFLTTILLFSTFVYSVNGHICGDSVYSVSFVGEAEDCGMEMKSCENDDKDLRTFSKEKCCSDITIVVETDIFNKVSEITINANTLFLTAFIITSQNLFQPFSSYVKDYTNYYSPLINKDITILYEVFLI